MNIHTGEIYGKQTTAKFVMYSVLKVSKAKGVAQEIVTLQNIDNPLSLFETTAQKLATSGYIRISQTPYIDLQATTPKKRKAARKPTRCPHTVDFLADRADCERPTQIFSDLLSV
ncbi:MAG TPA: hypothetical protein PL131_02885 [Methylotenera sp.]|nr:hypothetical protein [Methylotenera sp.]HPH04794.1 hypothetical protein [Methylotenera sp.]HPN01583.1 hypothetical protein [Methylotenera sp.]